MRFLQRLSDGIAAVFASPFKSQASTPADIPRTPSPLDRLSGSPSSRKRARSTSSERLYKRQRRSTSSRSKSRTPQRQKASSTLKQQHDQDEQFIEHSSASESSHSPERTETADTDESAEDDLDTGAEQSSASSEVDSSHHLNEESFLDDTQDEHDMPLEQTEETTAASQDNDTIQGRRRIRALPLDGSMPDFSPQDLLADGWEESHVTLVHNIARRGDPAIPEDWRRGMPHLPLELFTNHDTALLRSHKTTVGAGERAFSMLLDLGARMRCLQVGAGTRTRQQISERVLKQYMKWTRIDSGLDKKRALPIVQLCIAPRNCQSQRLVERATKALHKLKDRYTQAFQAQQTTEPSTSTPRQATSEQQLFHSIPTLYALICSDEVIALAALKPDVPDGRLHSVAFFDFSSWELDFWSALAIAIILCHARDVQMRIAEETGIGVRCSRDNSPDPDA